MNSRIKSILYLISGIIASILGSSLVYGYVFNAYIERIGDSDQSLLFWYLPLLMFGIIALGIGVTFIVQGINLLKKIKKSNFDNI